MNDRCWFLLSKKLAGNASDGELNELDEMLRNHPEWRQAVQSLGDIWDKNAEDQPDEAAFSQHIARMNQLGYDTSAFDVDSTLNGQPGSKIIRRIWLVAATVLGICCIVAGWMILGNTSRPHTPATATPYRQVATNSGDRKKVVLPEGTQVWLNSESNLEFDQGFGKRHRAVRLSGEAYFDVKENDELPFIIQTPGIQVKVTGTAFNVKAYPGEKTYETSLIRGRVEVTINNRPEERYVLKPNEKLVVRDEDLVREQARNYEKKSTNEPLIQLGYVNFSGEDNAAIETSWVYNRLIFDNESFGEIAKKLERWYGVKIYIENNGIADQRVTYTIKNETIAEALRNMQYVVPFNYRLNENTITITK